MDTGEGKQGRQRLEEARSQRDERGVPPADLGKEIKSLHPDHFSKGRAVSV